MIHNLWLGVFEKNESYPKAIALSSTVNWIAGSEEVANLWIRRGHKSFDDNYLMNKSWADKVTPSTSHVSPKGTSSSKSFHAAIDDSEQKQQAIIKINNTHREKLFCSIHYKKGCSAAFDLFHMFTLSVKFYTFH